MDQQPKSPPASRPIAPAPEAETPPKPGKQPPKEIGGPKGLEPTRYGDWERKGICVDF